MVEHFGVGSDAGRPPDPAVVAGVLVALVKPLMRATALDPSESASHTVESHTMYMRSYTASKVTSFTSARPVTSSVSSPPVLSHE